MADNWPVWSQSNEKDLAKYVNQEAVKLLGNLEVNRFDLLQGGPEERQKLIRVIYEALLKRGINYAYEGYLFEKGMQRIRPPSEILSLKQETNPEGTCLDLALLFCGICLGCDLLPVVILIDGHALAAVSLNHVRSNNGWQASQPDRTLFTEQTKQLEDVQALRDLIDDGAYIAIECTGFAHTQSFKNSKEPEAISRDASGALPFARAISAGRNQLDPDKTQRTFLYAIDIATARYLWNIKPLEIPKLAEIANEGLISEQKIDTIEGKQTGIDVEAYEGSVVNKDTIKKIAKGGESTGIKWRPGQAK